MALYENEKGITGLKDKLFSVFSVIITYLKNAYLYFPSMSLRMVRKIIARNENGEENNKLADILQEKLIPFIAKAEISGECQLVSSLQETIAKLQSSPTAKELSDKCVIGVGGKFSAGKSCFINSLISTDKQLLTEGQNPTTSIPTYIIKGKARQNTILSSCGSTTRINNQTLKSLTHEFYDKYQIGFSAYVRSLTLTTPDFKYSHIAILDTPGYDKADTDKKADDSDREKSLRSLKNVDRIIWLIDVGNGIPKQSDISYLNEVSPSTPILFVINKADKIKSPDKIKEEIVRTINEAALPCYDVIFYDSPHGKEMFSDNIGVLSAFLDEAEKSGKSNNDLASSVLEICEEIADQVDKQAEEYKKRCSDCTEVIRINTDLLNIMSVVETYKHNYVQLTKTRSEITEFDHIFDEIKTLVLKEIIDE